MMKTAARVMVTAGRRGGASAASPGWRWRLLRCAGERRVLGFISTTEIYKNYCEKKSHIYSGFSFFCCFFFFNKVTHFTLLNEGIQITIRSPAVFLENTKKQKD